MISVIDKVALTETVKASEPELDNDLKVRSNGTSIYSLTEIDSRNKLSEKVQSQNELATEFSNEVNSLEHRMPKWPAILNKNNSMQSSLVS